MSIEGWIHLAITVIGFAIVIGRTEQKLSDHSERILDLEKKQDEMPRNYVPRAELQAHMDGIRSGIARCEAMLNAQFYGRSPLTSIFSDKTQG